MEYIHRSIHENVKYVAVDSGISLKVRIDACQFLAHAGKLIYPMQTLIEFVTDQRLQVLERRYPQAEVRLCMRNIMGVAGSWIFSITQNVETPEEVSVLQIQFLKTTFSKHG